MSTNCNGSQKKKNKNDCSTSTAEISLIVKEYLIKQLWQRRAFVWCPNSTAADPSTHQQPLPQYSSQSRSSSTGNVLSPARRQKVVETLCLLSQELLFENEHEIAQMSEKFNYTIEQNQPIDYNTFEVVAHVLFSEGIKWVHILVFLLFGSELAFTHGVVANRLDVIDDIHSHLTTYLNRNVATWIADHQGWEGFVVYANERLLRISGDTIDRSFGEDYINRSVFSWTNSKVFKFGAAVGVIGIAAALVGMFVSSKH